MNEITEKTDLLQYPLLILKFMEKYEGHHVPMNIENCNAIWNSLTDEERETNKDYVAKWRNEMHTCFIDIYKDDVLLKIFGLG